MVKMYSTSSRAMLSSGFPARLRSYEATRLNNLELPAWYFGATSVTKLPLLAISTDSYGTMGRHGTSRCDGGK